MENNLFFNPDNLTIGHFNNKQNIILKDILKQIPNEKNINPELIYKELCLNFINGDTSRTDFNKYGVQGKQKPIPISEIFCDNILIVSYTPIELCSLTNKTNKAMTNQRKEILIFLINKGFINLTSGNISPMRLKKMTGNNTEFMPCKPEIVEAVYKKYNVIKTEKSELPSIS